jgi:diguanylate cyclase (GGDEF)-like protein/PAS domain S-box-containing protein
LVVNSQTHLITYANDTAIKIIGQAREQIIGKICHEYVCAGEIGESPIKDLGQHVDNAERILIDAGEKRIPVIKTEAPILINGVEYLVKSIIDMTEHRKIEEQLKYDCLTHLYNRTCFEQEIIRLGMDSKPVGVIVCDIDGLKLINDTLGHIKGDELINQAAAIIKMSCREIDFAARIGGDEFVILLPDGSQAFMEETCVKIHTAIDEYNIKNPCTNLSLSIGYSLRAGCQNISEAFQEADNRMYYQKLHHGQSARSAILGTLMKALQARDFITEGHTERVGNLGVDLATIIGLSERQITDIWLLGNFHDIGKVGIPDYILFKEGPLTESERTVMQSHCEIGYRIARSANDISHIADFILKHHEWWNGKGYPLRIKKEAIPIESRIIAIADAYDAMTSNRVYRNAMSSKEAIDILKAFSGKQFDPKLTAIFIDMVQHGNLCGN